MKRIEELASIELYSNGELAAFVRKANALARDFAHELEIAAQDLQTNLGSQRGNPVAFGVDSRAKARIVARHLKAASECVREARMRITKTEASYRKHFVVEIDAAAGRVKGRQFQHGR